MSEALQAQIEALCLTTGGRYVLSTGQETDFYFDCKSAMLCGPVLGQIADAMLREIEDLPVQPTTVGGLAVGADCLVAAIVQLAAQRGHPLVHGCVVRKEPKTHGTMKIVENAPLPGTPVVVVDDVFTTGRSTAYACQMIQKVGSQIVGIVGLIDREQGGAEFLAAEFSVPVRSLFKSSAFSGIAANSRYS